MKPFNHLLFALWVTLTASVVNGQNISDAEADDSDMETAAEAEVVDTIELLECNPNGGLSVTIEAPCDTLNYTFSPHCNVLDIVEGCSVTSKRCGCWMIQPNGFYSGVGSGKPGCANACVDVINQNTPGNRECSTFGESHTFEGACDSKGYIYTRNCDFTEAENEAGVMECTITENSCGCLWWEKEVDSAPLQGLDGFCDACNPSGSATLSFSVVLGSCMALTLAALF